MLLHKYFGGLGVEPPKEKEAKKELKFSKKSLKLKTVSRFPREPVSLLQLGAPTLCLRKRTPQNHLLWVGCCTYLLARFINEAVPRMGVC